MISFNRYIILLLLLLFSCNSSNTKNFIELKKAYYKWYNKNYVYKNSDYEKNHFPELDFNIIQEYIYDLKNFELELSQISKNQLKNSLQIDYDIILNNTENLLFNYEYEEKYKYSIDIFILKIYQVLMKTLNNADLMTFEKISIIKKQILHINSLLTTIKDIDIPIHNKDIEKINLNINDLIVFIDYLPSQFNIDIINYDQLNDLLKNTKLKLKKYQEWINSSSEYNNKEKTFYLNKKTLYEFHLNELFRNSGFDYNTINKFISSNIITLQSQIFDQCLEIYKINNDEPVWVDKEDTLNVISYVIDNNFRSNSINQDRLIKEFKNEYNHINSYISLLNLEHYFINEDITFILSEDYHLMDSLLDIYYNNCIINKENNNETYNKYTLSQHLFNSIIPIHLYESISLNSNQIRHIKNDNYNSGLSTFLNYILINNYYKNDDLYKLFFYLNLLRTNIKILNQDDHIYNKINKNDIIDNFINQGYMNRSESELMYRELESMQKIYISEYVMYLHLVNLYDKYCIIDNKYSPGEFFDKILKNGYIPYYLNN